MISKRHLQPHRMRCTRQLNYLPLMPVADGVNGRKTGIINIKHMSETSKS